MKEKISMVIFVLILGSILAFALVFASDYTAPLIEKNNELKMKASILKAFDINYTKAEIEGIFSRNVATVTKGDGIFYISRDQRVAFEISGSGLWGPINGIVAVFPDLKTIKGMTIIHQEETPGLGGRIAEPDFLNRFKGKELLPELIVQPEGKAAKANEIDGITGATLSCKALEKILNSESSRYISLIKESRQ